MFLLNPFTLMAVLYVSAGLFFAVLTGLNELPDMFGPANLKWLRVHMLTIGTITQVIFAALLPIVARRLGTSDRTAGETWLQWTLLNGGFILIIIGLVGGDSWTAAIGATLVFVAVWRLLQSVLGMWRASGRRWRESMQFYATAPLYLLFGIVMAVSILLNWYPPAGRIGLLEAHVHANVWGFLAMIVAGMLFDLFPAMLRTPMARPGWMLRIYWLLNVGALLLTVGPLFNAHPATLTGLVTYVVGTAILVANLLLTLRASRHRPAAAMQMVLSYLWMIVPAFFAPFIVLTPAAVDVARIEAAATQGLVNGWVLGMVMGALPRLLRAKPWRPDTSLFLPDDDDANDGSWLSVAALNVGVALIWATVVFSADAAVQALTISGYGLIAVAWIPFLRRVWLHMTSGTVVTKEW